MPPAKRTPATLAGPMQLIRAEPGGRLSVCEDAAAALCDLPGKLAICTVAGVYRSGKSFLLNQLTGAPCGFAVGSTVQACTKGIWMWGEPMVLDQGGEPLNVLFLDTEGLSSICADDNHDAKIFSLAILLSSMFVYNGDKVVNNAAIDSLSLVANLTERVRATAGGADSKPGSASDEADALAAELPDFVWLLRDAFLEMVDEQGHAVSAREYLEESLRPKSGGGAAAAERNETRAAITRLFRRRELFALPHPTVGTNVKEGELSKLNDLSKLSPQFGEAILSLKAHIAKAIRPKGVAGTPLTPRAYVALVRAYVASINDGAVPQIHAAWAAIAGAECERAASAAAEGYARALRAAVERAGAALERMLLEGAHADALVTARAAYAKAATGPSGVLADGLARLEKAAAAELAQQQALLDANSSARCAAARASAREALAAATAKTAAPDAGVAEATGERHPNAPHADRTSPHC
ncbi:guanylate-binding protein [Pavlovales sp. CCMP2436]|nr:guanylate-binding protein [Pavlovales sp. CCMP2436]